MTFEPVDGRKPDAATITLSGYDLSCAQLAAAGDAVRVVVDPGVWKVIARSRAVVQDIAEQGRSGYGITSGVGSQKDFRVSAEEMADYNRLLARAHATHVSGPELASHRVRAALIILANEFCQGYSGISTSLLALLVECINTSKMPSVIANGTVGASDLVPMSQIANWFFQLPAAQKEGLPRAKETLSFINNNAATLANGADVLDEMEHLAAMAEISFALSLEAFRGNLDSISELVNKVHRRKGQADASARLRQHLRNSVLWKPGAARRVQDPLSFRCGSQIHGALREQLDWAIEVWNDELNSVCDNPVVDVHGDCVRSHGNMDTTRMTLAVDGLRQALAKTMDIACERMNKQQWSAFSDLPTGLARMAGAIGGVQFLNLAHIAASYVTSIKIWANPSLNYSVGQLADGVEDTASHALHSVSDLERMLDAAWKVLAIEMIISVWAIQRREIAVHQLGEGLRGYFNAVLKWLPIGSEGVEVFSIDPIVALLRNEADGRRVLISVRN